MNDCKPSQSPIFLLVDIFSLWIFHLYTANENFWRVGRKWAHCIFTFIWAYPNVSLLPLESVAEVVSNTYVLSIS